MSIVVLDIGGTKTAAALISPLGKILKKSYQKTENFSSFEKLLQKICIEFSIQTIDALAIAAAGPVIDGKVQLTNDPMQIDPQKIAAKKVFLCNDMEALCSFLPEGEKKRVLIAPGTGLGLATMYKGEVFSSEGGHINFAPQNELEWQFLLFLQKKYGEHVSLERVVSGNGLKNIAAFFAWQENTLAHEQQQTQCSCPFCQKVLHFFLGCLGSFAGDAALFYLPDGGIYFAGGTLERIDLLSNTTFLERFSQKGRMEKLLSSFTLIQIKEKDAVLEGAIKRFLKYN